MRLDACYTSLLLQLLIAGQPKAPSPPLEKKLRLTAFSSTPPSLITAANTAAADPHFSEELLLGCVSARSRSPAYSSVSPGFDGLLNSLTVDYTPRAGAGILHWIMKEDSRYPRVPMPHPWTGARWPKQSSLALAISGRRIRREQEFLARPKLIPVHTGAFVHSPSLAAVRAWVRASVPQMLSPKVSL
jgi:hypothetical protein